ncbi:conserved hypothetical protein [Ricinus communis]|uniref:Uncharacterized protein n=1 Tax=Ricinus communis TaxID=3988 RepID=B9SS87_RICCO|nr:conserved hypothetical protein [Ricinus communis]
MDGKDVETDMDENPTDIEYLGEYSLSHHLSLSPPVECDDIEPHITKSPTVILPKPLAFLPIPHDIALVPEFVGPLLGLDFSFLAATASSLSISLAPSIEAAVKFAKQTLHQLTGLELLTLNKDEQQLVISSLHTLYAAITSPFKATKTVELMHEVSCIFGDIKEKGQVVNDMSNKISSFSSSKQEYDGFTNKAFELQ